MTEIIYNAIGVVTGIALGGLFFGDTDPLMLVIVAVCINVMLACGAVIIRKRKG